MVDKILQWTLSWEVVFEHVQKMLLIKMMLRFLRHRNEIDVLFSFNLHKNQDVLYSKDLFVKTFFKQKIPHYAVFFVQE